MPVNIRLKAATEDKTVKDLIVVATEQYEWYEEPESCVLRLTASGEEIDMWKFLDSHFNCELNPRL